MTAYDMRISDWSSDVCSSDLLFYRVYCKHLINLLSERPELLLVLGPCSNITRVEWTRLAKHSDDNWQLLVFNKQGGSDKARIELPINKTSVSERSEARRVWKECVSMCNSCWILVH